MNLQEEVDSLRVQAAQDAATVHELRSCLEQEREGKLYITGRQISLFFGDGFPSWFDWKSSTEGEREIC